MGYSKILYSFDVFLSTILHINLNQDQNEVLQMWFSVILHLSFTKF